MGKQKIVINKEEVRNLNLDHLGDFLLQSPEGKEFLLRDAGVQEYKLYAYLSELFNDTIILDIGTRYGNSCVALSANPKNKVISYDLVTWPTHSYLKKDNIELKIQDWTKDMSIDFNKVSIIMIDVDPHDGVQEVEMLRYLTEIGWSGLLLFDDISPTLWPEIAKLWDSLDYEKYDLTDIGHYSGTGLINFGQKYIIEII